MATIVAAEFPARFPQNVLADRMPRIPFLIRLDQFQSMSHSNIALLVEP
jgi:hypothetical protein